MENLLGETPVPVAKERNIIDRVVLRKISNTGKNPLVDLSKDGNSIYITNVKDLNINEIRSRELHFTMWFCNGSKYHIEDTITIDKNLTFVEGKINLLGDLTVDCINLVPESGQVTITNFGDRPTVGSNKIMKKLSEELTRLFNEWLNK